MESYVLNGCAQQEFIMGSTGVLNGKVFWMLLGILLCAGQDIIGVLNGKLLCAQLEIIGVLNGKLNGKLCAQLDIIGVLN